MLTLPILKYSALKQIEILFLQTRKPENALWLGTFGKDYRITVTSTGPRSFISWH